MRITETTFYYVRHGETDWNRERRFQGQTDIPVNVAGMEQAKAASDRISSVNIKFIYSSPLRRALETAKEFQAVLKCDLEVIDNLAEANLGVCEGAITGPWYQEWKTGACTPEGAEPYADFIQRALSGINQALAHDGPVLIVSHGVVYRAIRQYARLKPSNRLLHCVVVRHDPPALTGEHWQTFQID